MSSKISRERHRSANDVSIVGYAEYLHNISLPEILKITNHIEIPMSLPGCRFMMWFKIIGTYSINTVSLYTISMFKIYKQWFVILYCT